MPEKCLVGNQITRKVAVQFGRNLMKLHLAGCSECLAQMIRAWRVTSAKLLSIKSYQSDQIHYLLLESDHWLPNRRLCSGHKSNEAPRD